MGETKIVVEEPERRSWPSSRARFAVRYTDDDGRIADVTSERLPDAIGRHCDDCQFLDGRDPFLVVRATSVFNKTQLSHPTVHMHLDMKFSYSVFN